MRSRSATRVGQGNGGQGMSSGAHCSRLDTPRHDSFAPFPCSHSLAPVSSIPMNRRDFITTTAAAPAAPASGFGVESTPILPQRVSYLGFMRMPTFGLAVWREIMDAVAADGGNTVILWMGGAFQSKRFPITWQWARDHENIRSSKPPAPMASRSPNSGSAVGAGTCARPRDAFPSPFSLRLCCLASLRFLIAVGTQLRACLKIPKRAEQATGRLRRAGSPSHPVL
jgi:hypothetical protein